MLAQNSCTDQLLCVLTASLTSRSVCLQKPETSEPTGGITQPETAPTPSFGQVLKPNEGTEKPAAPPPAPEAAPKPAFSFSNPAETEVGPLTPFPACLQLYRAQMLMFG